MYSNDYSKELGERSVDKQMPTFVAVLVFLVLAVGLWFGYRELKAYSKSAPPPVAAEKK